MGRSRANNLGHPIADAHPGDLNAIVFPGQDYNNARVFDFQDVDKWENNKRKLPLEHLKFTKLTRTPVDRTKSSRMGWADISISLSGAIVDSLSNHFVERWYGSAIQLFNSFTK